MSTMDPLAATYLEVQRAAWEVAPRDEEELGREIQKIAAAGRKAWPGVDVDPVDLARFLAERAPDRTEPVEALAAMATVDLYLACACLTGDDTALAAFEQSIMSGVAPAVARIDKSRDLFDAVAEEIRVKMLRPADGSRPRLASYLGRGPLRSWVQVAAMRAAYSMKRLKPKDAPEDMRKLAAVPFEGEDAELAQIRAELAEPFAKAFEKALASLAPRDRNVLRMYVIEGLSSEAVGKMYGVHRATVARWIARAQAELFAATKKNLKKDAGVPESQFESLVKLLESQLDLSLSTFLDE